MLADESKHNCFIPLTQTFFPFKNQTIVFYFKKSVVGFPGGAVVKNPPANAGDTGSKPGLRRSHMPQSD